MTPEEAVEKLEQLVNQDIVAHGYRALIHPDEAEALRVLLAEREGERANAKAWECVSKSNMDKLLASEARVKEMEESKAVWLADNLKLLQENERLRAAVRVGIHRIEALATENYLSPDQVRWASCVTADLQRLRSLAQPEAAPDHAFKGCDKGGCANEGCHYIQGHGEPCRKPESLHKQPEAAPKGEGLGMSGYLLVVPKDWVTVDAPPLQLAKASE